MHVHRYERLWIWIGTMTMMVFFAVLLIVSFGQGLAAPNHVQTIDPAKISSTPPFDHPGLRKLSDGNYEAYYVGQVFSWNPQTITVPVGSTVRFYVTASDVVHGFLIPGTDVNLEVMPGWVSAATQHFDTPGEYLIVCNQYCGSGHQNMFAKVEVK